MKVLFVWPNKDSFGFKPIGISLLSGIARKRGWDTALFDTTEIDFGFTDNTRSGESAKLFKQVDLVPYGQEKKKIDLRVKLTGMIRDYQPDCLAVSVLSDEHLIAAEISAIAKEFAPDIPIIWGGKFPTLQPLKTLKCCHADFACVGEGFGAFEDFLNALSNNGSLYTISNIWAKRGNGEIIRNKIRPLKKSLDDLPYVDWDLFDKRQFYKPFDGKVYMSGDHMLNWGCPYRCTYCINHFYHNLYENHYHLRRYGTERIIRELQFLKDQYHLDFIKFHDEDFLMRPLDNLQEFSDAYQERVNVPFVIETNPKSVTEKKVALLKKMNCVSASVAIETGDPDLNKNVLHRVNTDADVIKAFSLLKNAGIRTSAFIMLGIPFETRRTYQKTIELTKRANVQYPNVGFFYPFEGTELRRIAISNGFFDPDSNNEIVYRRDRPALTFEEFSDHELIEMRNVFVLYVKLPKCYEPFIRRSERSDAIGIRLRNHLLNIYDRTVWANDGWYRDDGMKESDLQELREIFPL